MSYLRGSYLTEVIEKTILWYSQQKTKLLFCKVWINVYFNYFLNKFKKYLKYYLGYICFISFNNFFF